MSDIAIMVKRIEALQEDKRVSIVQAIVDGKDPAELINDYLSFRSVADRAKYAARKAPSYRPAPQPVYAVA